MTKILIKNFKQLSKEDTKIAGGKGASLGEMTQSGIPVPQGFVILSNVFDRFLEETDLNVRIDAVLNTVNIEEIHTVENASEKIQAMILSEKIPKDIKDEILKFHKKLDCKFVAVRSSATVEDGNDHAWAGQLDSFLNTTEKTLLENVKKCWASLFTARAIFYRFEKKLSKDKISVAVVIQKMVNSEKSGVAFSVHPVTEDYNQIIIEAGFGLGEAIVSGLITPDSYVVEKKSRKIIDSKVNNQIKALSKKNNGGNKWIELKKKGKKQVLTEKEIIELSELIVKIENHYGFPCDIEWAKEKGNFYIVQSRPITTLNKRSKENKKEKTLESQKYELHFTGSGFNVLLLDMIFNIHTYGEVDYIVLYENDINRSYLSHKGLREAYYLSKQLLDDLFFETLLKKTKKLLIDLEKYKETILTSKNSYQEFKKMIAFNNRFCEIYRFYEQPFQQALEKEVLKKISKDKLIEILLDNSFAKLPDIKTKKYVKRLFEMGKIKLQLHKSAEEFSSSRSFEDFLAKKYKISSKLIGAMRIDELKEALHNKFIVTIDELKKRLEGCVFVKENKKWNLYTGKRFIYWKKKLQKNYSDKIIGDTAYRGIVKGRVVIHLSWTAITNIKKGDVLVTGMTNPQMIPLIKKAIAIITDEGGITCHAAIIARELKKPCIIGTKNATQILKDGDLVEVDADNGIVNVMK